MATKTYVEYSYLGLLFGDVSSVEVNSRDIEAAKKAEAAEHAVSFRFYDRTETEIDGEVLIGEPKNYSERYMINGSALSLADVKEMYPDESILISNMECNGWDPIWKTTNGRFTQFPKDARIA